MIHYHQLIEMFGAPNGLCTSITEAKHIKCVKEPWRRSNRFRALGQMLLTNQRTDKLTAAKIDFEQRGMLSDSIITWATHLRTSIQSADQLSDLDALALAEISPEQPEEAPQVPDDPDGGPVHTRDITHRVILAHTPHKSISSLSVLISQAKLTPRTKIS